MSTTPGDGQPADQPPGQQSDDAAAREWWDDPGLPWKHKPTKADISCLVWMGIASVYGLILLPLRPVMLGLAPHLLGSLGYRTGLVMTGALGATGDRWWPLVLVLGSLMAMKFDWIYWWAGKLWGHGLIEVWSGRSEEGAQTQPAGHRVHAQVRDVGDLRHLPADSDAGRRGVRGTRCGGHEAVEVSDRELHLVGDQLGVVHVPGLADR